MPCSIVVSDATPSTMAASITWPRPVAPALVQGGEDAEGEVGAAAAEVGQQVQRRQRRRVRGTEREHAAGDARRS